ncbi:MAG TPA: hypothetical protein VIM49_02825 [Dermatophilaceae bacterium]
MPARVVGAGAGVNKPPGVGVDDQSAEHRIGVGQDRSILADVRVPARWSRTPTAGNPASTLTTAPGRAAPAVANPAGNARSTTVLTQAWAKIRSTNASARA